MRNLQRAPALGVMWSRIMDRRTAEEILDSLAWMELAIGKLGGTIKASEVESERKELFNLTEPIISAHIDLIMRVAKEYPELDPDGKGEEFYHSLKVKYQTVDHPAKKLTKEQIESARSAGKRFAAEIQKEIE